MDDLKDLFEALYFAAEKHVNQKRKGPKNEPYINHLIEVSMLLLEKTNTQDLAVVKAGLLHDILEDTDCTENELAQRFGEDVLLLVKALTDDKLLSLEMRRELQMKHVGDFDDNLKLIKLADHCSNIASIPVDWSEEKLNSYLAWSIQIAEACSGVSIELDDEYKLRYQKALA